MTARPAGATEDLATRFLSFGGKATSSVGRFMSFGQGKSKQGGGGLLGFVSFGQGGKGKAKIPATAADAPPMLTSKNTSVRPIARVFVLTPSARAFRSEWIS